MHPVSCINEKEEILEEIFMNITHNMIIYQLLVYNQSMIFIEFNRRAFYYIK